MACPSDAKPHSDNLNSATTGSLAVAPGRDDGNGALTVIGLEQMMRLIRQRFGAEAGRTSGPPRPGMRRGSEC